MKSLFFLISLLFLSQSGILAQDLLILNNNDSIPCRIKNIDPDSSVYYRAKGKNDLYNGYLKKNYYSKIINNYYTGLKRCKNPNNSLGYITFGMQYGHIALNPIIDLFINNKKLLNELSNGCMFSLSYQTFFNPIAQYQSHNKSHTNLSLGLNFGYFTRKVNNRNSRFDDSLQVNMKRQAMVFSLLVSYNTDLKYPTFITFKPGFMLNRYSGNYISPLKSRATTLNVGVNIDQKLHDFSKKFSLFLSADPYILIARSGKIEYEDLTYSKSILYLNTLFYPYPHNHKLDINYGFSIGLTLKYFY